MKKFILIFDIHRENGNLKRKVNRELHKINSNKLQHSVWESTNLESLKQISKIIKMYGGQVIILEKKIIHSYI